MKRVNNIYQKVCDVDNIMFMAHKVCLNTKNKKKVDKFETFYTEHITNIKNILDNKNYLPGKYNIFLIHEPKVRLIMSQSIPDKIINHLVAQHFLVDTFDRSIIDTSIATREGKGTHYGLKLVRKYINEAKRDNKDVYCLKIDIKKYFYNIDHEITKKIVRTKIKDKDALKLIDTVIDSTDEEYVNECIKKCKTEEINKVRNSNLRYEDKVKRIEEVEYIPLYAKGKGMSIGNMSSQIFGIIYLNEIDHFIKEKLHIKYFLRYMDDLLLIHNDKDYLKYCKDEIEKKLKDLKLELNIKKTKVENLKCGVEFLGFKFYLKNNRIVMKVVNKTKKKFKTKTKEINLLYENKYLNDREYKMAVSSYVGHLRHGNCNKLICSRIDVKKIHIKIKKL